MKHYTANTNYTVVDRSPLHLQPGDKVTAGTRDQSWPGWIWVTTAEGRGSYVPEEILDASTSTMREAFSARDLSVTRGERIAALREVKGWLWCRNGAGEEGWLPEFVLRPAAE